MRDKHINSTFELTINFFKGLCFDFIWDRILVPIAHGVLPELGLAAGVGADQVLLGSGVVSVVQALPLCHECHGP